MDDMDRSSKRRRFTDQFAPATDGIGADGLIRGEISSDAGVCFGGTLDGDISAGGLLRGQSTGRITGRVTAAAVVVEGRIDGEIEVSGAAELKEGCRVTGSISAATVAIADGATFDGSVSMKGGGGPPRRVDFIDRRNEAEAEAAPPEY